MRGPLRLLTLAGLVTAACLSAPPAATACELNGFSASPGPGGVVRPGDSISYSIHAISTDASPGSSEYRITAGGIEVARGMAEPDSGGQWTRSDRFQAPDVGAYQGYLTVTLVLGDSAPHSVRLPYDGRPATPPPPTSAAPAATPPPAPPAKGVRAPATKPRAESERSKPVRRAHPRKRVATPAQPATGTVPAPIATPQPVTARTVAPVQRREPAPRKTTRATTRAAHQAVTPVQRRERPWAQPAAAARPAQAGPQPRDRPVVTDIAMTIALVLLLSGGAGGALLVHRRRTPEPEPVLPTAREFALEAELQELIAEERARAERPRTSA